MATTSSPSAIQVDESNHTIEVDDSSDQNSTYASTINSETASLSSSIFNYVYENGRRYTNYRPEKYHLPNDETEQDRLDMAHHLWNIILRGALSWAPLMSTHRVLDLGTGTGIWAIDFGDENPEANVLGTDLSAIQPAWVPPNVRFEVDDFEEEWSFAHKFDYIHGRYLIGSVSDWKGLIRKCFENTTPGGFVEFQEADLVGAFSYDDTYPGSSLSVYNAALLEAGRIMGRPSDAASRMAGYMREVGFVDVVEQKIPVPVGTWAKGTRNKEMGVWLQSVCLLGAEAYGLAAFTRVLGWEEGKARAVIEGAVRDFKDGGIHTIYYAYVVHGRKPEKTV